MTIEPKKTSAKLAVREDKARNSDLLSLIIILYEFYRLYKLTCQRTISYKNEFFGCYMS